MTELPPAESQAACASEGDDRGWARPLYARQIAVLGELAEAGLEVALAIRDQVKTAAAGGEDATSTAMAYARAARAVRLTLLLQSNLIKQLQDWDRHTAYLASQAVAEADERREDLLDEHKARTVRIVERVARRACDDAEHVERLVGEAAERLDQDDLYGEVLTRPVSELVAAICQDLGLDPDWPRLAREAWAREEISSGAAGSPLMALAARELDPPPPSRATASPLGRPPDRLRA